MGMDGKEKQGFKAIDLREINGNFVEYNNNWEIMESGEDEDCEASSTTSTVESSRESSSMNSIESSSSELAEDASSSSSPCSTLSNGPLYELSELMVNLPIKRGLSKFYQGKSQSFTSLASAKSLEDLAKRVNNNISKRKKMKSCKSYGGNLDAHKFSHSPKASIAKKASKGSFLSPFSKINNRFLDG